MKSVQQSAHAVLSRRRVVVAGAAGMLSLTTLTAGGGSAIAATHATHRPRITGTVARSRQCPVRPESAASVESCIRGPSSIAGMPRTATRPGVPAAPVHGGKVMAPGAPVNCRHPHLWNPVGHTMTSSYKC